MGFFRGARHEVHPDSVPIARGRAGTSAKGFFLATGGDTENKTTKLKESATREKGEAKPPADLPKIE